MHIHILPSALPSPSRIESSTARRPTRRSAYAMACEMATDVTRRAMTVWRRGSAVTAVGAGTHLPTKYCSRSHHTLLSAVAPRRTLLGLGLQHSFIHQYEHDRRETHVAGFQSCCEGPRALRCVFEPTGLRGPSPSATPVEPRPDEGVTAEMNEMKGPRFAGLIAARYSCTNERPNNHHLVSTPDQPSPAVHLPSPLPSPSPGSNY